MTKAKKVREALSLTPTQCCRLLLGSDVKRPYDTWVRWEKGKGGPTRATDRLFDLVLILKAEGLLELVLKKF